MMNFQELTERLMPHRCLLLRGEVNTEKKDIIATVLSLLAFESNEPVWLHIDSGGGDVNVARHLGDTIRAVRAPVFGLVTGMAASAAFTLLQMCDRRIAYPNARLLFHSVSSKVEIDGSDLRYRIAHARLLHRKNIEELAKRSGQPIPAIRRWSRMERMFSAQEALELGFLDAIEHPQPKG